MLSELLLQRLRARVSLLHGFSDEEIREFVEHCSAQSWPLGHRVITEGTPGNAMYIVLAGTLHVQQAAQAKPILLATLDAGDTFGELALLDFGDRSASVDALTDVRLLQFERSHLIRIPALSTKLYHNLALMLAERLRETNTLVSLLAAGAPHPKFNSPVR